MKEKIQITILSRDRPEYLRKSLDSVLSQRITDVEIEIVISDNSEKDEVERLIGQHYTDSNIKYIRRQPTVSAIEHIHLAASECKEKYMVIFHDDDIMRPDYVETMSSFLPKDGVAAVGCNALAFEDDISKVMYKLHNFTFVKEYKESKEFLSRYLPGKHGIAPFAGHIYNTKFLKK